MNPLFSFNQTSFLSSHSVILIKHQDLMAIITVIMGSVLVAILVIYFSVQQKKDSETQESDFSNNSSGIGSETNLPEPDLDMLDHSSCESGILELHNLEELDKDTTENRLTTMLFPGLSSQMAPLQTLTTEAQAENQKNGLKVACLVISVSTTGIVSFLVGFSGNQSPTRNKLLFKAVILSMCSSLISALILLVISTIDLNFSCSILTLRIIIWISTGLMTLGVVLLIAFYFHSA